MAGEPIVWIIDSEQWPRAFLRAELIERGLEAVGFVTVCDAILALHHPFTRKPHLIVLELHGLTATPEELDRLAQTKIPILLLGGSVELSKERAEEHVWAEILRRPFTIGGAADKVEELLARDLKAAPSIRKDIS